MLNISRTILSWLGLITPENNKGAISAMLSTLVMVGCPVTLMRTFSHASPSIKSLPPRPSKVSLPPPPIIILPPEKPVWPAPSMPSNNPCKPLIKAICCTLLSAWLVRTSPATASVNNCAEPKLSPRKVSLRFQPEIPSTLSKRSFKLSTSGGNKPVKARSASAPTP